MEISSIFFVAPSQADSAPRLEQHGESNGRSYSPLFKAAGLIAVAMVAMVIVFTLLPALIAVALAILTSIGIMHNIFTDCCCCCEDNSSSTPSRPSYRTDTAGVPMVHRRADQTPRTPDARRPRQEGGTGASIDFGTGKDYPATVVRSNPATDDLPRVRIHEGIRLFADSEARLPQGRSGTPEATTSPKMPHRAGDSTGFGTSTRASGTTPRRVGNPPPGFESFGTNTPENSRSPRRAGDTTGFGEEK